MPPNTEIAEDDARRYLSLIKEAADDRRRKAAMKFADLTSLASWGETAAGIVPDAAEIKRRVLATSTSAAQVLLDSADSLDDLYDTRKAAFDAIFGKDLDNKENIDQTTDGGGR